MRKEIDFLLSCVRSAGKHESEEAATAKTLPGKSIDWTYLIDTADLHGLMPLLYRELRTAYSKHMPKETLDSLRGRFHHNSLQNMLKTEELTRVLGMFKAQGIPAIAYKGPVLAAFAYGDLSLRQFCDLDILIHERDINKVKELLLQQGYIPELPLNSSQEKLYSRFQRDRKFSRRDGKVTVEIQWDIPPRHYPFSLDLSHLIGRAQPFSLNGHELLNFAPEDTLLILCIHGLYHCWERAGWVCDVAKLIEAHQIMNWEFILSQAENLRCEHALYLGLFLAKDIFKTSLPINVQERMEKEARTEQIASRIRGNLFRDEKERSSEAKCVFAQIRTWKRLRDKIYFIFHLGFDPSAEDWKFLKFPAFLTFLYSLLRPIRLLFTYGWHRDR